MRIGCGGAGVLAFPVLLAGSLACADPVTVRERFLDAPTEWCPADRGIPVVVEMRGLVVHEPAPPEAQRNWIGVRRGSERRITTFDDRSPSSDAVRVRRGAEAVGVLTGRNTETVEEFQRLGTLHIDGRRCASIVHWDNPSEILWRVVDDDGTIVQSGTTERWSWRYYIQVMSARRYPEDLMVGEARLIVRDRPEVVHLIEGFPDAAGTDGRSEEGRTRE